MGDYEPQEFMDLFGGMPERGEALVDPRAVADDERERRQEDPGPLEPHGSEFDEVHLMTEPTDEEPEPTCVICGQTTHRLETAAACLFELRRRERPADVEADEMREERWEP